MKEPINLDDAPSKMNKAGDVANIDSARAAIAKAEGRA